MLSASAARLVVLTLYVLVACVRGGRVQREGAWWRGVVRSHRKKAHGERAWCGSHRKKEQVEGHLPVYSFQKVTKMPDMATCVSYANQPIIRDKSPVPLTFTHVVFIFVVCSTFGLLGETIVSFFLDGRWESGAGFVLLPFSPIYGVGALLITLFVNPLRGKALPLQFVVSAAVGGMFEYLAGWFLEWRYGIVAWSYIDQPFNLHGHTSLWIALVWGVIGIAWITWVLPVVAKAIEALPQGFARKLSVVLFVIIVADALLTLGALDCWFMRMSGHAPSTPWELFFAEHFGDAFMSSHFETMSMWPVLAGR